MSYCKYCGHSLDDDAAFCSKCGKAVPQEAEPITKPTHCPKCGKQLSDEDLFCPKCGYNISVKTKQTSAEIICKKCGNKVHEGQQFCYICGTPTNPIVPQKTDWSQRKLHCPRCKSREISHVLETVETIGGGGTYGSFGFNRPSLSGSLRAFSLFGSKNINENSWICKDCGLKFRNIDELESTHAKSIKRGKIGLVGAHVIFGIINFAECLKYGRYLWAFLVVILYPLSCIFFTFLINCVKKKWDAEEAKLRHDCFD